MAVPQISERAQSLLRTLIECYVREGSPVGSRVLARHSELDLSPATIRNVMADLEELGLVRQPHTSAGRVPTPQGYRVFVDSLLAVRPLEPATVQRLERELAPAGEPQPGPEELIRRASRLLSQVTHLAGLVTLPRPKDFVLRHVDFVPLSGGRVLAILVVNESEVQNYILRPRRRFTRAQLEQAANYVNRELAGRTLEEARARVVEAMRELKGSVSALLQASIDAAERARSRQGHPDYVMAGQTNLMDFAEFADVQTLRRLFEAFQQKEALVQLLDQCLEAEGVQIFIGEESGYRDLGDCSLVSAPYEAGGRVVGALAVIGPTRIPYERVIPIVDVTARLLGAALDRA